MEQNITFEENEEIDGYYTDVHRAVDKMCQGFSNLAFIKGRGGIGKSFQIKKRLIANKADFIEITGEVTEAFLYQLIYENNGKIIWLKDVVKILTGLKCMPYYTKVRTNNGIKSMKDLNSNEDKILSWNFKLGKEEWEKFKIWPTGKKQIMKITTGEGVLESSPEHKWIIKTEEGQIIQKQAKDLNTKDVILYLEAEEEKGMGSKCVKSIELTTDYEEMYDIEVQNNHNFILDNGALTHNSINLLKAATETERTRVLTKSNYSKQQEDLPNTFICRSKFIFDYNNISGLQLRDDFEALISRGDFIELPISDGEIIAIMKLIAKDDDIKKVTEFLIENFNATGLFRLNLRTQYKCMQTYNYALKNNLDWKKELEAELKNISRIRALLYSLIGPYAVKRLELKKRLLKHEIVNKMRTADRKINEWLFLEELFVWSEDKRNPTICINQKPQEKIDAEFVGR